MIYSVRLAGKEQIYFLEMKIFDFNKIKRVKRT